MELHPFNQQAQLLRYAQEQGIAVTGFSPLGAPSYVELGMAKPEDSALTHPAISEIAAAHGASSAQAVL